MKPRVKTKLATAEANNANLPVVDGSGFATAPSLCPGAQSKDQDDLVDRFAVAIPEAWQKCSRTILETARQCAEANEALDPVHRDRLLEKLPFKRTMFSKLASIGRNTALYKLEIEKILPPNWTSLRELRKLNPDELDQAIEQGIVRPDSSRIEIQKWVSDPKNCKYAAATRATVAARVIHQEDIGSLAQAWEASPDLVRLWARTPARVRNAFTRMILKS